MFFQINTFSIQRLNNAEYAGFMINLQKLMSEMDGDLLGIDHTTISEFNRLLNLLVDQVYSNATSPHTATMQAADLKRGRLYKKIRLKLQAVELAEEGSSLLSIVDLVNSYLLSKYGTSVPQKPYQEETAILQGFIYDLRDKLTTGQQKELAITDDIDSLEAANEEFVTAYNLRVAEQASAERDVTVKLRNQLLDLYRLICVKLQYTANCIAEGKEDNATECQQFIALLNQLLSDAKKRLEQRKRKDGKDGKTDEDGDGGEGGSGQNPGEEDETVEV